MRQGSKAKPKKTPRVECEQTAEEATGDNRGATREVAGR